MFVPSRIVVIDDNETHLKGLKDALNSLRLDCHAVHYDEEIGLNGESFPRMRVLFLDLHLITGGGVGAAGSADFAILAGILEVVVDPSSGPYILVLWTQHSDQLDDFRKYLDGLVGDTLDNRKRPVATYALNKGDYINVVTGDRVPKSNLHDDIKSLLGKNPQMKALFGWEADVLAAMDATLRSIIDLVPKDQRTTDRFGTALGKVLYRLSQAGAGQNRAMEDPRSSVNRVLVPILADRISEHDPEGSSSENWVAALVADENPPASTAVRSAVNTAIHISSATAPQSVSIRPTDLGAVLTLPFPPTDESLSSHFGIDVAKIRSNTFFGVQNDTEWQNCELCLVQIGAACDHAQPNDGPLLYLLAIEWPFTGDEAAHNLRPKKSKKTSLEWRSPIFSVGTPARPGCLSAFLNCSISVPRERTQDWQVKYRFRDELISQLTQEYARHISRPGIVSL